VSKLRKVGYARVSSRAEEQLHALENQLQRLQAQKLDQILHDVGSGRDNTRPNYLQLLALVDSRDVDEVVVARTDRLGRDSQELNFFIALCGKRGVALISLETGRIQSETPDGFLASAIQTAYSEFESRMLSLRIRRGWEAARRRSEPARGRVPWGYRYNEDGTALEIDPVTGPKARQLIEELREQNWRITSALKSFRDKYDEVPLATTQSLKTWLFNPVLRGGLGYHYDGAPKKKEAGPPGARKPSYSYQFKDIVWNTHEALLTHEEWRYIEARSAHNRAMWGRNAKNPPRLLTGLCVCGGCGKKMSYRSGKWIAALNCHGSIDCPRRYKGVHEHLIIDAINSALSQRAADLLAYTALESPELNALRKTVQQLEAENDPDFADALARKRRKLKQLEGVPEIDPEQLAALRDPVVWSHMPDPQLRAVYEELVDRVVVSDPQTLQVVLRF
jgi:DNA invertase Pin-like site-specific DNA recombinase